MGPDGVIPIGMEVIEGDVEVVEGSFGDAEGLRIILFIDRAADFKTGLSFRGGNQLKENMRCSMRFHLLVPGG